MLPTPHLQVQPFEVPTALPEQSLLLGHEYQIACTTTWTIAKDPTVLRPLAETAPRQDHSEPPYCWSLGSPTPANRPPGEEGRGGRRTLKFPPKLGPINLHPRTKGWVLLLCSGTAARGLHMTKHSTGIGEPRQSLKFEKNTGWLHITTMKLVTRGKWHLGVQQDSNPDQRHTKFFYPPGHLSPAPD